MTGVDYRAKFLVTCFAIAIAALLAVMSSPASAHAGGAHDAARSVVTDGASGEAKGAGVCCRVAGACVAQFLPDGPAVTLPDAVPSALAHGFAAVRHASIPTATDPPPPRP